MRISPIERQWQELMLLCSREEELAKTAEHPKLLRLMQAQIAVTARDLGFTERQIQTREFRAERADGRIVRVITG